MPGIGKAKYAKETDRAEEITMEHSHFVTSVIF